jgi:hypothetical protein
VHSEALNLDFYQIISCLVTFLDGWVDGSVPVIEILNLVDVPKNVYAK